ncbi:MAG: hypothetical protein A2X86_03230 [Bdellovibrionales bacterium GWA2_49_15]|nr:MAG: hypothetical protein A2X86_03230 [Bdellovibrionales bacterium GWA2_49_15]HAZ12227.1 hypothetical protein [Bdellovibrionales bacterium]
MILRNLLVSLLVVLSMTSFATDDLVKLTREAFGRPGIRPNWSDARKVQSVTIYEEGEVKSPLWFTEANGILTEIFFPTIDKGQIKDSQFMVTDHKTFVLEESKDFEHNVQVLSPSRVRLVNVNKAKGITIIHEFFSLKDSPTLVDEVTIIAEKDGVDFYLLTNPAIDNTGYYDSAIVHQNGFLVSEGSTQLFIESSVGFRKRSVGFVGSSDGYQDLAQDKQMDFDFEVAQNGNVATFGELNLPRTKGENRLHIIYHFAQNKEIRSTLGTDFGAAKEVFEQSWRTYLKDKLAPKFNNKGEADLYWRSLVVLKSHEDKLNPGALIASLSIPWGEKQYETPGNKIGGYHLIWPRDLYHTAMGLLLAGDIKTPIGALRFLKKIQYQKGDGVWDYNPRVIPKEGGFPQNTWVTGESYWGGLQLDQIGYPINLFWQVYRRVSVSEQKLLLTEFDSMLKKGLSFIQKYGPWSAQERWEENFGLSPSTFSSATSALLIGGELYKGTEAGDSYYRTAQGWLFKPGDNIDTWSFTQNGPYGDGQYYLRVSGCQSYSATWDPNSKDSCHVANSSMRVTPQDFLDQGFLKLALLGLRPADDWHILKSLEKVNQFIRVKTPNGYGWYRYSNDAYGEDGKGRLWTLLSGEQGRFAVERYSAGNLDWNQAVSQVNTVLESMVKFANDGQLIPEQIFEHTGEGTGGATPLAWSHAEFIKLLWARETKINPENPFRALSTVVE